MSLVRHVPVPADCRVADAVRAAYTRPQFSFLQFYASLARTVPDFARQARIAENETWNPDDPLLLAIADPAELQMAVFPEGSPEPTNPIGAAALWWIALLDRDQYLAELQALTWRPPAWGDYECAYQLLDGAGMMQFVEPCLDDDSIAYVKFMPNVDHTMQAFAEAAVPNAKVLTMVRCDDGLWRAWALSDNSYFPSADEVRGTS